MYVNYPLSQKFFIKPSLTYLPILEKLIHQVLMKKQFSLRDIAIVYVHHPLKTSVNLIDSMIRLGGIPKNIFVLGKKYSECDTVVQQITRYGVHYQPCSAQIGLGQYNLSFTRDINLLWKKVSDNLGKDVQNLLILDHGGYATSFIPVPLLKQYKVIAVEKTTAGLMKFKDQGLPPFPLISVADAKTALSLIQEKDYHLILMDIGLPDMDGIALTHRIRLQQWQQTDTTPIIGLTAHIDLENRQRCLDAGMNTVITKPLKKETALELLTTFVPDACINQVSSLTDIRPVTGPVLDVEAMKALLKNEELIKDCIHLMMIGLKKDLIELPRLHQSANWQAIREIAHKLQGGASYIGAKRLEQACKQIDDYIRENGPIGQTNELYRELIKEMEAAQTVCEEYLKK